MMSDSAIPQWKKELIARLRSQNRRTAQQFSVVQQPVEVRCECADNMVQADFEEDLHYGPGIVHKLRERYLSLAQREKAIRPTVLRKAASLENILDNAPEDSKHVDYIPNIPHRIYQANGKKNAKRQVKKNPELKRAHSAETISTNKEKETKELKRESLHEDMLIISNGNLIIPDKPPNVNEDHKYRINKPKRVPPIMNEKEKPPIDVVKQTKRFFEKNQPVRSKDGSRLVAQYCVIFESQHKPAVKIKPPMIPEKKQNGLKLRTLDKKIGDARSQSPEVLVDVPPPLRSPEKKENLPSPIPDISRIDCKVEENGNTSLTETPDLIPVTSSPLLGKSGLRIPATESFIQEENRHSSTLISPRVVTPLASPTSPVKTLQKDQSHLVNRQFNNSPPVSPKTATPLSSPTSSTNHFQKHQPPIVNKNVLNSRTPTTQPLKLEVNGVSSQEKKETVEKCPVLKPLTTLETEKNKINAAIGSAGVKNQVTVNKVPNKVKNRSRELDNTSQTFCFKDRKDVPDYVPNHGVKSALPLERPKVGEGGYIILPGAGGESFTDEDEEIQRSLERPPSPCDVIFVNDNILIDGKSSLSQKTKKPKLRISFVEEGPEIYEYPSETSLLIDDPPQTSAVAQMRHSVPLAGNSSLANYTPKSTEDFQPGVTRSVQNNTLKQEKIPDNCDLIFEEEVEEPILFSAGSNSDILF